jgi:hypothetical protein
VPGTTEFSDASGRRSAPWVARDRAKASPGMAALGASFHGTTELVLSRGSARRALKANGERWRGGS